MKKNNQRCCMITNAYLAQCYIQPSSSEAIIYKKAIRSYKKPLISLFPQKRRFLLPLIEQNFYFVQLGLYSQILLPVKIFDLLTFDFMCSGLCGRCTAGDRTSFCSDHYIIIAQPLLTFFNQRRMIQAMGPQKLSGIGNPHLDSCIPFEHCHHQFDVFKFS